MQETCEPETQVSKRVRGPDKKPRRRVSKNTRDVVTRMLNKHGPQALQTIVSVMHNEDASISERLKAAVEICNRAFGMPTKQIEANVQIDINTEFLEALKEINAKAIEVSAEVVDAEIVDVGADL